MEPNAMTLSTVHDGQPSSRIVLLKGFDESGFVFYTNYKSKKGKEMVRIEGIVEKISEKDSTDYYHSRGKGSQIGAWASPQSEVIPNRELLEKRVEKYQQEFDGKEIIPRPEHWGGYRVKPHYLEFWQGRKSRLHDRIAYALEAGTWRKDRLAP
ncbi:UNVERIFIED_CONTAM: hypothetical protein GTU68_021238 [Idotea baltica]|nr:hypothetical protein [Idotea baltica]